MKFGTMLGDVLKSAGQAPATERYPLQRREAPPRLRGMLVWNREHCTACGLCAKDCPANALEVIAIDKKAKRIVLRYHVDRCTFCAQCVSSCRQGALQMQHTVWELAALSRDAFVLNYGDPADVEIALAGPIAADAEPAAES